ncbi:MAG: rhamnose/proton symporter RhaT [Rhodospirillales bacterium]|nr:rhamnose/proton symporter RhaT [Rhodospirillales bacterium]
MTANPMLGVLFHWIGGLASASFYVPYKGVQRWSWEIFWLVGGVFSWIIAPWIFAALRTEDLFGVLAATPARTLGLCYLFGALWGFGGLTYGLTVRYLGISLGTAIALGLTAAFGTLIPPLVSGQLIDHLIHSTSGLIILGGVAVCLAGIAIVGFAGRSKEREQIAGGAAAMRNGASFRKGVLVAIFAGIMSSCFAYGLAAGEPIRQLTIAHGTAPLWQGLPVLVVVLLGGFTTNAIWCVFLIARNRSAPQLVGAGADGAASPLLRNYLLCALAGTTWYFQFFFYTMGESQMGTYGFSSWTLHMASIIIFASLWGVALFEWKGASRRTKAVLCTGIALLVVSTVIIGAGNAFAA